MKTSPMTAKETLAYDWYFFKLDLFLAGMPGKQVKEIKKDLKAAVHEAARQEGAKQALKDLGPANVLAANYLEAHAKPVPRIWAGLIAFAVLLYGWLLAIISMLEGSIETARALTVTTSQTITSHWLFTDVYLTVGPDGIDSFGFGQAGWNVALFLITLFGIPLLFARVWRAWKK